ncbi:16S rRNA (Guanine966-N2)-methyltransferase [Bosea sp. LC85]|uniref:DoxX family protein n=1 Tax=Bosea sp. LC85 TaxID=1502851 RepID=UPI0004E3C405|nr:DoxX family protein [Bosea sp. LC85]KFC71597.1 16S rRNA (Guanine966-N2)-methyltransferase [Bosea sp. LC85]
MPASSFTTLQQAVEGLLSQSWLALLARIAVAAPFLISGVAKLADFGGAVGEVRGLTGLEPAAHFAVLVILTQLGGSALLIAGGRYAWIGAAALAGFTAVATLYAHAFWLKPAGERFLHQNIFFEHVSIVGGLVLLAVLSARLGRGAQA